MKKNLCELVFILDRSGSMSGLESDTIGGYNSMLEKQRKESGEALVTTVLFDDNYELLHDRINIKGICNITDKDYFVRGTTALLDAIGKTIIKIENAHKHTMEDERPDKTLFIITTDGLENASCEFNDKKIKKMIEERKESGWEFIFLGANIDAVKVGKDFGINESECVNYHSDGLGTSTLYDSVSEAVSLMRVSGKVDKSWRKNIDEDYESRKSKN